MYAHCCQTFVRKRNLVGFYVPDGVGENLINLVSRHPDNMWLKITRNLDHDGDVRPLASGAIVKTRGYEPFASFVKPK